MVEYPPSQLDNVFHALADPTRRAMLHVLAGSERTVSELAAPFSISLAAVSKHVKTLERAGLIERSIEGRTHTCRLNAKQLAAADRWLSHYEHLWSTRFNRLESILARQDEGQE